MNQNDRPIEHTAPKGYPIKLVRDETAVVVNPSGEPGDLWYGPAQGDVFPWLRLKLIEEVAEYVENRTIAELADVLAVIEGLAVAHGYSLHWLVNKMTSHPRGGFLKGVLMYGRHSEFDSEKDATHHA